ncbi:hypothetical protein MASR1M49_27540 [Pararhodobacter aggregans]
MDATTSDIRAVEFTPSREGNSPVQPDLLDQIPEDEARMRCLTAFAERIAARDPDCQTAEIHIRVAPLNHFDALGTAEFVRVA